MRLTIICSSSICTTLLASEAQCWAGSSPPFLTGQNMLWWEKQGLTHAVGCGIPQGSLWTIFFTLFMLDLWKVISHFKMFFHCYADTRSTLSVTSCRAQCMFGGDKGVDDAQFSPADQFKNWSHPHWAVKGIFCVSVCECVCLQLYN